MAINKAKKVEIVSRLGEVFKRAKTVVFVNFHGLKVAQVTQLRRTLKASGSGYLVAKKTLIRRALSDQKLTGDLPPLDGEVGLAYGEDQLGPAKIVREFGEKLKEGVKIIGGIFEGAFASAEKMQAVAAVPGRPELYGQLVVLLNSPLQQLASVLHQVAEKKVNN